MPRIDTPRVEARATARYVRMSPRKVRLIADMIRAKSVARAEVILTVAVKAAKVPVLKLLRSAAQNAQEKKMDPTALYIARITVDGGPMLKRSRARAFGRAAPIRKRTCHITIILAEK